MKYTVIGIGSACIDLIIPVTEEFLSTIPGCLGGSEPIDLQDLQTIIETNGIPPYMSAGGSCANVIKGLAQLDLSCAFMSMIGADHLGDFLTQHMQELGIHPLFFNSRLPTSRVLCLVTPNGQRTMRYFHGSSKDLGHYHLSTETFENVKLVHLEAYLVSHRPLMKETMILAKQADSLISFDLSSFEIAHQFRHFLHQIITDHVDILFGNRDEVEAFTGLSSPVDACKELQKLCPTVVVLMGKEGCIVGHQGETIHCPAYPVEKVIDTTGAGDLFASGFLYGFLNDRPLRECATMGNRLGAEVIQVPGAELPKERWEMVKKEWRL